MNEAPTIDETGIATTNDLIGYLAAAKIPDPTIESEEWEKAIRRVDARRTKLNGTEFDFALSMLSFDDPETARAHVDKHYPDGRQHSAPRLRQAMIAASRVCGSPEARQGLTLYASHKDAPRNYTILGTLCTKLAKAIPQSDGSKLIPLEMEGLTAEAVAAVSLLAALEARRTGKTLTKVLDGPIVGKHYIPLLSAPPEDPLGDYFDFVANLEETKQKAAGEWVAAVAAGTTATPDPEPPAQEDEPDDEDAQEASDAEQDAQPDAPDDTNPGQRPVQLPTGPEGVAAVLAGFGIEETPKITNATSQIFRLLAGEKEPKVLRMLKVAARAIRSIDEQ